VSDPLEEYRLLRRVRAENVVPVREPLALISQIQRSGGTLLSQLFDGHTEVHAHPGELHLGHQHKLIWPRLDLGAGPERWFDALYEQKVGRYLRKGYSKASRRLERGVDYDVLPFVFSPTLQRELFLARAEGAGSERDVFDAYFTSFFNAWLDDHNLYTGPKRVVTGFAAGLASRAEDVDGLFAVYPDGWLVSIVRDPRGWYESARRYKESYEDVDAALAEWRVSTEAAIAAKEARPDRVAVLSYEELVREPERVMRALAERLRLTWSPVLLEPTFNGRPIRADSSEPVARYGILPARADAYRESLGPELAARIEAEAADLHARALELV
jgi:Sulfotransferase family